ncbi:MAG: hypothetical protein AAFQ63_00595 [Cyanobacteria bacterium J06621_11]
MASSGSKTARFRSATDFPKTIQTFEQPKSAALYEEMRDCLIFTNRSRAQLIRRNQEHKNTTLDLRSRIDSLQTLINQLKSQKQSQIQEREALITQLAGEMTEMSGQLNTLSEAFDAVGDIESEGQTHWGRLVFPSRIMKLIQAVTSVMKWWKTQDNSIVEDTDHPAEITGIVDEQDRLNHPERYTDQASINRSLLDR